MGRPGLRHRCLLALTLLLFSVGVTAALPKAGNEYVNDHAGLLLETDESELRERLADIEYYSGVEITVLTIESFSQYSNEYKSWESFATALFNHWGVGNLPENNGVLFLVAREGRKIRIELGAGYPDRYSAQVQDIIDHTIYPEFRLNNFSEGIISGVDEIIETVTRPVSFFEWYKWHILAGIIALLSTLIALAIDKKENPAWYWLLLAIAGFCILGILRSLRDGESSDGFGGGSSDGGGGSGGD